MCVAFFFFLEKATFFFPLISHKKNFVFSGKGFFSKILKKIESLKLLVILFLL